MHRPAIVYQLSKGSEKKDQKSNKFAGVNHQKVAVIYGVNRLHMHKLRKYDFNATSKILTLMGMSS
jgi:hypothetical protein